MLITKIRTVKTPSRGTKKSAGFDFYVPEDIFPIILNHGESISIPSGIKCSIPQGYALIAFNKSGVALNQGLDVGACVVDEDYQGEVHLHVTNNSKEQTIIQPGQKLIQFVLVKISNEEIYEKKDSNLFSSVSERGAGGFGSTGIE